MITLATFIITPSIYKEYMWSNFPNYCRKLQAVMFYTSKPHYNGTFCRKDQAILFQQILSTNSLRLPKSELTYCPSSIIYFYSIPNSVLVKGVVISLKTKQQLFFNRLVHSFNQHIKLFQGQRNAYIEATPGISGQELLKGRPDPTRVDLDIAELGSEFLPFWSSCSFLLLHKIFSK